MKIKQLTTWLKFNLNLSIIKFKIKTNESCDQHFIGPYLIIHFHSQDEIGLEPEQVNGKTDI